MIFYCSLCLNQFKKVEYNYLLVVSIKYFGIVCCYCFLEDVMAEQMRHSLSKVIMFQEKKHIPHEIMFDYIINYYNVQFREQIKQNGEDPEFGVVGSPLDVDITQAKWSYLRVKNVHFALLLIVARYKSCNLKYWLDKCINCLINKFVNHGTKLAKTKDDIEYQQKFRQQLKDEYNIIEVSILTSVDINRNTAADFTIKRGNWMLAFDTPPARKDDEYVVALKVVDIIQFKGLQKLFEENLNFEYDIFILCELWCPSNRAQWKQEALNDITKLGNHFYLKENEICEYARSRDEDGEPEYIVVSCNNAIESLRQVRKCNGMNDQQAENWHRFDDKFSNSIDDKMRLFRYGMENVDNIDEGGCVLLPKCHNVRCDVLGCRDQRHVKQNKLYNRFGVYHTCPYDGVNRICLVSSMRGGNAHNLFKQKSVDCVHFSNN